MLGPPRMARMTAAMNGERTAIKYTPKTITELKSVAFMAWPNEK